jgi:hypothetical protein
VDFQLQKELELVAKVEFTVPGPLFGYRQTTKKTIWHPAERERSKAYGAFKEKVRILAFAAGLPNWGGVADRERPPRLSVYVRWKGEPRIDWKNLYGSLEDSLWYEQDRHVIPGKHSGVTWSCGQEEAVVTVEW